MSQKFIFISLIMAGLATGEANEHDEADYKIDDLKQDVLGSWQLSDFAEMIRDSVLGSSVEIPWELIKSEAETEGSIEPADIVTLEIPFLIPAAIVILLAFLVPLIGICFCCCRCCGNCGGDIRNRDIASQTDKGRYTNAILLLIFLAFLGAMGCCIPISGQRMLDSPALAFETIEASVHDILEYIHTFVQDVLTFVSDELDVLLASLKSDLEDLPNLLSEPLTNSTSGYMDDVKAAANSINQVVDSLPALESDLNATIDSIKLNVDTLKNGIVDLNANLTNLIAKCQADNEIFCDKLVTGSTSNVNIDTTEVIDMASQLSDVISETSTLNLTEYITLADDTFESLPSTINDSSHSAASSVIDILDTIPDDVLPMINDSISVMDEIPGLSSDNVTFIKDIKKEVLGEVDQISPLLRMVMFGLGGILLLITVLATLGLLLGCFCAKKYNNHMRTGRGGCSSCGSALLMCSCGLGVIFVFYFCVLGSFLLLLGTNFTVLCEPLQDLTIFDQLLGKGGVLGPDNGTFLGHTVFNDSEMDLSISSILKSCEAGSTAYAAMSLSSYLNLSSMFNASEFVPDFGDTLNSEINSTIQDIHIVNQTHLDDIEAQLSFPTVNTSDLTKPIKDELDSVDLTTVLQDLNAAADGIPSQAYKDDLHFFAQVVENLEEITLANLRQNVDEMASHFDMMAAHGNTIEANFSALSDNLKTLQTFIENTATDTVVQTIDAFVASMKAVPDTFIASVEDKLSTDIGKCKVVADIYRTLVGSVCTHFLDSFNVFWASIYVGGLMLILVMILSAMMTKYFKQPTDRGNHLDHSRNAMTNSPPLWHLDLNSYDVNTSTNSSSESPLIPQRKKFRTGSDSPQLIAVRSLAGQFHSNHLCSVCTDFQQKTEANTELQNFGDLTVPLINNIQVENSSPDVATTFINPASTSSTSNVDETEIISISPQFTTCSAGSIPENEVNFIASNVEGNSECLEISSSLTETSVIDIATALEVGTTITVPEHSTSCTVAEIHNMSETPELLDSLVTEAPFVTADAEQLEDVSVPEPTISVGVLDITAPSEPSIMAGNDSPPVGGNSADSPCNLDAPILEEETRPVSCVVYEMGEHLDNSRVTGYPASTPMAPLQTDHADHGPAPCQHWDEVRNSVLRQKKPISKSDISLPLSRESMLEQIHRDYRSTFINVAPADATDNEATDELCLNDKQNNCNAMVGCSSALSDHIEDGGQCDSLNLSANNSNPLRCNRMSITTTYRPTTARDVELEICDNNQSFQRPEQLDLSPLPDFVVDMDNISPEFSRDLETMQQTLRIHDDNSPDEADLISYLSVCSQDMAASELDEPFPHLVSGSSINAERRTIADEHYEHQADILSDGGPNVTEMKGAARQMESLHIPAIQARGPPIPTTQTQEDVDVVGSFHAEMEYNRNRDIQNISVDQEAEATLEYHIDEVDAGYEDLVTDEHKGDNVAQQNELLSFNLKCSHLNDDWERMEAPVDKDVAGRSSLNENVAISVIQQTPLAKYHLKNNNYEIQPNREIGPGASRTAKHSLPLVLHEHLLEFGCQIIPRTPTGTDPDQFKRRNFVDNYTTENSSVKSSNIEISKGIESKDLDKFIRHDGNGIVDTDESVKSFGGVNFASHEPKSTANSSVNIEKEEMVKLSDNVDTEAIAYNICSGNHTRVTQEADKPHPYPIVGSSSPSPGMQSLQSLSSETCRQIFSSFGEAATQWWLQVDEVCSRGTDKGDI